MVAMEVVLVSVNEDGVPYKFPSSLLDAIETLEKFPNDTCVITVKGSDAHGRLLREAEEGGVI